MSQRFTITFLQLHRFTISIYQSQRFQSSIKLCQAALSSELLAFTQIPFQTAFSLPFLQNASLETNKTQAITYAQ